MLKNTIISILLFSSLGFGQKVDEFRYYMGIDRYSLDSNFLQWTESYNYGSIISELIYPFSGTVFNTYGGIDGLGINGLFVEFETLILKNFDTLIGTDTDFRDNEPRVWLLTEFKTKPKFSRTYIDIGYNFRNFWKKESDNDIRIFISHFYYKSVFSMTDGVNKVWLWSARNRPFLDLDSWYRTTWNAIGLGLQYKYPIRDWLFIDGKVRYFPKFTVKGDGYWNLRKLTFVHRGTDSEMFSVNFNLSFKPINFCILKAAYNLEKMSSSGKLISRIENGEVIDIEKTVTFKSQLESRVSIGIEFRIPH